MDIDSDAGFDGTIENAAVSVTQTFTGTYTLAGLHADNFSEERLVNPAFVDDFEIELRKEAQGWLQSTSTFHEICGLSEEQDKKALQRLIVLIKGDYLGEDLTR